MSGKLKIYACSGIGDVRPSKTSGYDYWTDNTNSLNNTQAVNTLLAKINLLMSEVENLELTDADVLERLNTIDLYVVCLEAAQSYAQHYTKLQKAGNIIGQMISRGDFDNNSLNNSERDRDLDELLDIFNSEMQKNGEYDLNPEFLQWWNENVISRNQIGLTKEQRTAVQSTLDNTISGIGANELDWRDNKELSKYLSDGSTYFLYTYFTDAQLNRLPNYNRRVMSLKKQQQLRTYNYCKSLYVGIYGSEKEMQDVIRAGIIGRFKETPEQVCEDVVNGNKTINGIGVIMTASAIASIVVAVVGAIVSIIVSIIECVAKSKSSQYAAIDRTAVESSTPNGDDFDGLLEGGKLTAGSSSMLPVLILGGAALIYFLRKRKNKNK